MSKRLIGVRRALTANIVKDGRRQCFKAGMDAYMNKPIRQSQLAETLVRASDKKIQTLRSQSEDSAPAGERLWL